MHFSMLLTTSLGLASPTLTAPSYAMIEASSADYRSASKSSAVRGVIFGGRVRRRNVNREDADRRIIRKLAYTYTFSASTKFLSSFSASPMSPRVAMSFWYSPGHVGIPTIFTLLSGPVTSVCCVVDFFTALPANAHGNIAASQSMVFVEKISLRLVREYCKQRFSP